jgi:predicted nucleotidyltransferase
MKLARFSKAAKAVAGEGVEDIILFGSVMKGKEDAADIDILIVFRDSVMKSVEMALRGKLKGAPIDINSITSDEFRSEGFVAREGAYLEGYSLIREKTLAEMMGFTGIALIKYDISKIKGSKRIRFYYALHGRDSKGFLDDIGGHRFAENVLACDYEVIERAKPFFETWGVEYVVFPVLIPERLKHIMLK